MSAKDIQHALENASSLFQQGRHKDAMRAYSKIVEADPGCGEAWLRLGALNHQHGNLLPAEECYRSAIRINRNDVAAASGWCALLTRVKRPAESDELIRQLIDNHPENPEVCFHVALLCSTLGRHADALDSIDGAIENAPAMHKYKLVRADILARRGDFEEAFDILKPYLEAKPPHISAVLVFSNFSHVVGLKEECIRLLEKVRENKTVPPGLQAEAVKAIDRVQNASLA